MGKKIIITTTSFSKEMPELLDVLNKKGLQVVMNDKGRQLEEGELQELLQAHKPCGLLAGTEPITGAIITQSSQFLKVISRVGAGWDNIDHAAAGKFGILVYRTTGVLAQAVAELTIGFILAALRKITIQDRLVRDGKWHKPLGGLLSGKTVGLIGFGEIGGRIVMLTRAFGAYIIYYDLATNHKEKRYNAEAAALEEML